ncbi:hypothetical protein K504DRAFT_204505 [Pleomassaria siparia CBS 279.74]|uniref:Uncharacterized protein n=1 Tax=Pleomassaria siparia CBS 279.74 TaxID=1314801 RepID=A0A6G1KHZ2_9PLEO|nr:hypothetical protein K504DRAFT_204505 [Pleomassaria siparia CBS 279.74]
MISTLSKKTNGVGLLLNFLSVSFQYRAAHGRLRYSLPSRITILTERGIYIRHPRPPPSAPYLFPRQRTVFSSSARIL